MLCRRHGTWYYVCSMMNKIEMILFFMDPENWWERHTSHLVWLQKYSPSSLVADSVFANTPTPWNVFVTPQPMLVKSTVIRRHAQNGEKLELPNAHISSWGRAKWCSAFLFQVSYCKQITFLVIYLVPCFSHFCAFCWRFCYFKWPPTKCWSAAWRS